MDNIYHLLHKKILQLLPYYGALVFWQTIVWIKIDFHEIFSIFTWCIIYFFNGIFNFITKFCVFCQYFFIFIHRNNPWTSRFSTLANSCWCESVYFVVMSAISNITLANIFFKSNWLSLRCWCGTLYSSVRLWTPNIR